MALIRYPGSKEKLTSSILRRFPDEILYGILTAKARWEYREPFFGAGAVGFKVLLDLSTNCPVWLNDIDPGMVALWRSVRDSPEKLIEWVEGFEPSGKNFELYKEEDGRIEFEDDYGKLVKDEVQAGFRKLALHRISFSGLGAKAGGPIGGKNQENKKYRVGCRWKPQVMAEDIVRLSRILNASEGGFRFTNLDFADLIRDAPRECFIYADPPYYEKGPELYKYSMGPEDHGRLAELLRETKASWVLSYDNHPEVRRLYDGWAKIEPVSITYTTARARGERRPKNEEIIITPRI